MCTLIFVLPLVDFQMDKASIIKDAIEYIQELHEQERTIQAEIMELESGKLNKNPGYGFEQDLPILLTSKKKKKTDQFYDSGGPRTSPIEVIEVSSSDLPISFFHDKNDVIVKINLICFFLSCYQS